MAAGSSDTEGLVETSMAGRTLQAHWGAPVRVAHLTGPGRRVADVVEVVEQMRSEGRERIAARVPAARPAA